MQAHLQHPPSYLFQGMSEPKDPVFYLLGGKGYQKGTLSPKSKSFKTQNSLVFGTPR